MRKRAVWAAAIAAIVAAVILAWLLARPHPSPTAPDGSDANISRNVRVGQSGWLFYEPDIRFVAGPGFLDHAGGATAATASAAQSDPLPAIFHFHRQLQARGIRLIVFPTPVKTMVHPEKLWPASRGPRFNASWEQFKRELESQGVGVFDITAELAAAANTGDAQYLTTDTHWLPRGMETAAQKLAAFIKQRVELPPALRMEHLSQIQEISSIGDLAEASQFKCPQEAVTIHRILQTDGQPWAARRDADVLLLGDSFSIIYSAEQMGWGSSAGLCEHLSHELGRPLDALRRSDNGAIATRQMLADELSQGRDRLAGKKAVIWQFAARELTCGDWPIIELRLRPPPLARFIVPPPGQQWIIEGDIADKGPAPRPGNVAYRDHIMALHLTNVKRDGADAVGAEAVVYVRSMINMKLTDAAGWPVGHRVRLKIRDWSEVARQFEFINRSDLPQSELRTQPACWGEAADR